MTTGSSKQRQLDLMVGSGVGWLVRRADEVLYVHRSAETAGVDAADSLVAAFRGAASGEGIESVTLAAQRLDYAVPAFVVLDVGHTIRLAAFGDIEIIADDPSMPRLSAAGSGTWVERTLRTVDAVELSVADEVVDEGTDLGAGTIRAGGFRLAVSAVSTPVGTAANRAAPAPAPRSEPTPAPSTAPPRTEARWTPSPSRAEPSPAAALPEAGDTAGAGSSRTPPTTPPRPVPHVEPPIEPHVEPPAMNDLLERRAAPTDATADFTGALPAADSNVSSAAVLPTTGWQLRFLHEDQGRAETERVESVDGDLVIGRSPVDPGDGAHARLVAIDCRELSKNHLHVRADDHGVWLTDLGSRNRTWIMTSGDRQLVPIEPHVPTQLDEHAHVQIGSKVFLIERTPR